MFKKFKKFWSRFWGAFKDAYNKVFKHPVEANVQDWRETNKINLLGIFVSKLNNLANAEATFSVVSDSVRADKLKALAETLEEKRFDITAGMLADGDVWVFPATNERGDIYHTHLTQEQVRIVAMDGDEITEAYGIIDWCVDSKSNRTFYLLRHHRLDANGSLAISYSAIDDLGNQATVEEWEHLADEVLVFANANHIGFGRYKSPVSSRGLSPVYGVPLNFGCGEIEERVFHDLQLIEAEFNNAASKIFTDPRNLVKDEKTGQYNIIDNIFAVQSRAGQASNIDIYNPNIRSSEHYEKLQADLALYEKQVGTSKGILTDNENTSTATATEVRRANADTLALLGKIRAAIDKGNRMTLEADAVFLNIATDLWQYSSDWYDPFEDAEAQWKRLVEAKNSGAAEDADLVRWLFPDLTADEIEEKLARINSEKQANSDQAIERILNGGV